MSNFDDNFDQPDVDPAAEFLAREQDELAGLEDEVKPAAVSVPQINGDGARANSFSSFEMVEGVDQNGVDAPKEQNGDEFNFENSAARTDLSSFGFEAGTFSETFRGAPSPTPKYEAREEPEKIKKWREEQVERLEEKDKEEEKKRQEWREIAKKELEEWYRNHEEAIAKTKAANRNAEKQFVAEDNEIEPGTEWERIAKLCEFNPKAKQGSKDVSRMRSIILQLKQSPLSTKQA